MARTVLAKSMTVKLIISRQDAPTAERIFDGQIITIGGDPSSTLHLSGHGVAPEQAIILNEDGRLLLINRADGTSLNDEALPREARRTLSPGDTLKVGPYSVSLARDSATTPHPRAGVEGQGTATPAPDDDAAQAPPRGAQAAPPPPEPAKANSKSFASILDSLRTEEDSFYFQIESGGERRRVLIEEAEMLMGWDETGQRISCEAVRVVAPRAVVRKDWSGVVILPMSAGMASVNGEPVESPRRLRNGDRLTLLPTTIAAAAAESNYLVFHEPTSLVVLDTLLPQQLPPPVSSAAASAASAQPIEPREALAPLAPGAAVKGRAAALLNGRRYFGYFTLAEVSIMIFGTLLAAVVIFLILEFW